MNPASRLYDITAKFSALPNFEIKTVWQQYLELDRALSEEELISISQAALGEIKATSARLVDLGLEEELFATAAAQLKILFSPLRYTMQWAQVINPEIALKIKHALLWGRWALAKFDEDDLPSQQVEALVISIASQRKLLVETKLPLALRELLERQVEELQTSLLLYKVSGVAPLASAVNKQISELNHVSEATAKEYQEGTPEVKTAVKKTMELLSNAAKVADVGSKLFKFGEDAIKYGQLGWEFGKKFLD